MRRRSGSIVCHWHAVGSFFLTIDREMRKVLFLGLLTFLGLPACLTSLHAQEIQWRYGIGLALEYLNAEAKEKDDFSALGLVNLIDRKQTQKVIQVAPSLEVGVTYSNQFYVGVLASWRYCDAHTKSRAPMFNINYFIHQFKLNSYANLLAKLGYQFPQRTMIYGLIGPSIAKWSHTTNQYRAISLPAGTSVQVNSFKLSKTTVGLAFGFGVEQSLNDHLALHVDYVHGFLKDKSANQQLTIFVPTTSTGMRTGTVSKKVRPSYDSIALCLSYFF